MGIPWGGADLRVSAETSWSFGGRLLFARSFRSVAYGELCRGHLCPPFILSTPHTDVCRHLCAHVPLKCPAEAVARPYSDGAEESKIEASPVHARHVSTFHPRRHWWGAHAIVVSARRQRHGTHCSLPLWVSPHPRVSIDTLSLSHPLLSLLPWPLFLSGATSPRRSVGSTARSLVGSTAPALPARGSPP